MTGPFYSVGPIKNVTLNASNITDFISTFRDTLLDCNWLLLSSFVGTGGTPGYILESYPTPVVENKLRLKVYYNGDNSGLYPLVRFMVYDSLGTNEQLLGFLSISSDHGDKSIRVICGPHQFFIFIDTTVPPNSHYTGAFNVNNIMAGTPRVLNGMHSEVYWGLGDLGHQKTFRDNLVGGGLDQSSFLINGVVPGTSFPDAHGNTKNCNPLLVSQRSSDLHITVPFFNNNWACIEPLVTIGRVPNQYYGVYLWDAIVVSGRFPSKVISSADNRLWESLTISTDPSVMGSLFLVTDVLAGLNSGGFSY